MRSTFFGLNIAQRGLSIAQRQVDLTGHNVANVNTEGYTRERLVTTAVDPANATARFIMGGACLMGGGVKGLSLDQIRDTFLDRQFRNELTRASYWETRYNTLYYVEDVFNNVDTTANLNGIMKEFFNALQEVSTSNPDEAVRKEVVEKAQAMIETFHSYYAQMKDLMYQQDDMLVAEAEHVNTIARQIADLNAAIFKFELGGNNANDLRDKRNLLLDELSGILKISYDEIGTGKTDINGKPLSTLEIKIGDRTLVNHDKYSILEVKQDTDNAVTLADSSLDKLHSVWIRNPNDPLDPGVLADISGGIMQSYIDLRDGNVQNNQGIPFFITQLNKLVSTLVTEFNKIHKTGYTVPITDALGITTPSKTNVNFFDPSGLTLATIALSSDILDSVLNLAASREAVVMAATEHFETGNNEIAKELAKLIESTSLPGISSSFERYYNTFITGLASEVSYAKKMTQQEWALCDGLEAQRMSISGVSLDEEMTDLVRFQNAYNASARVLTAMDEALDVLINRTGRVGL